MGFSPIHIFFSVASIGKHWNKDHSPKTEQAILGLKIIKKTLRLIKQLNPKLWYIENLRGKLRKVINKIFIEENFNIDNIIRHTVTY